MFGGRLLVKVQIHKDTKIKLALLRLSEYLESRNADVCEKTSTLYLNLSDKDQNEILKDVFLEISQSGIVDLSESITQEQKENLLKEWHQFTRNNLEETQKIKNEINKCDYYLKNATRQRRTEENINNRKIMKDGYVNALRRKMGMGKRISQFSKEIEEKKVEFLFQDRQQYIIGIIDGNVHYFHVYFYKGNKVCYLKKGYPQQLPDYIIERIKKIGDSKTNDQREEYG